MIELTETQKKVVVELVNKAFEKYETRRRAVLCLKAPGGFGKTICSLAFTAVLAKKFHEMYGKKFKCIFFTRTRSQLSSFVRDYFKLFGKVPSIRLNKEEVCKKLLGFEKYEQCTRCPYFRDFAPYKLLDSIREFVIKSLLINEVYDPYTMIDKVIEVYNVCPYHAFAKFDEYFIVCTYPYLLNPDLRLLLFHTYDIYNQNIVKICIVDEAHNLDNAYLDLGYEVSVNCVRKVLHDLNDIEFRKCVDRLFKVSEFEKLEDGKILNINENLINIIYSKLEPFVENILKSEDVEEIRKYSHVLSLYAFVKVLTVFETQGVLNTDVVMVKEENKYVLKRTSFKMFYEDVVKPWDVVLFMSATLQPKWYIEKVWGIPSEEVAYVLVKSRPSNVELYIDTSVTTKFEKRCEKMWRLYAEKLMSIYEEAEGSVLAVFPSYEILQEVKKYLHDVDYVEESKDLTLGKLMELLNKKKLLVLAVAGGRFVEGVEFRKDDKTLITDVVIVGVPYPKKSEFLYLILKNIVKLSGVDVWEVLNVWAMMKVEQALRRVTRRGVKTRVKWWLLDKRFVKLIEYLD